VVEHSSPAALRSKSGGGGGPFIVCRLLDLEEGFGAPVLLSSEVVESFACASFRRSMAVLGRGVPSSPIEGRTRRFCLLGGRISSRSTGTPRETRNSLRIRERVQFGGCMGGGDTSCCQSERERSERKGEVCWAVGIGSSASVGSDFVSGSMALRYGCIDAEISSAVVQDERSRGGYKGHQWKV